MAWIPIWPSGGDAGFVEETGTVYASFYTDSSKGGDPAVFQYDFSAESGAVFDDVSVSSLARIFSNDCSVIGEYKVGEGNWIQFFSLTTSTLAQPVDVFEHIYDDQFSVRYTVSWINAYWSEHVQLFRSSSAAPGIPGDYAFTFSASLVTDIECDMADIAGDDRFVNLADFAALAADFGLTAGGLTGDIDGDGDCDLADLRWLAGRWLHSSYEAS